MKKINKNWFTLVELLVVITILTIISVVAYQNFWWATDKALSGRKINDVATIESALLQYKSSKNYYPAVWLYDVNTNLWWYNSWSIATPSNMVDIEMPSEEITAINSWSGWWRIYWSGTLVWQIWAKWTIWQEQLLKEYLSKDLYDPEIWDKKVWTAKMIDKWIWRYVYWVYNPTSWDWWNNNRTWKAYNIGFTIKDNWSNIYITKIVWDYDEKSCWTINELNCPKTLIWTASWLTISWTSFLVDKQKMWDETNSWIWNDITPSYETDNNFWIPYSVSF